MGARGGRPAGQRADGGAFPPHAACATPEVKVCGRRAPRTHGPTGADPAHEREADG